MRSVYKLTREVTELKDELKFNSVKDFIKRKGPESEKQLKNLASACDVLSALIKKGLPKEAKE